MEEALGGILWHQPVLVGVMRELVLVDLNVKNFKNMKIPK